MKPSRSSSHEIRRAVSAGLLAPMLCGVAAAVPPRYVEPQNLAADMGVKPADANVHVFTYTFSGQATDNGQPCAKTNIVIRVNSSQSAQLKSVTTQNDGRYSISFRISALQNEPVQWSIEAHRRDLPTLKLEGQRITMQEQENVEIDRTVEFAALPFDSTLQ
ncbi:MAG TPA: hypothetical protein VMU17_08290 [Elusimicrobiota bacterium]|nr:hypothetical protein [Elusimicrobiota bacterium]